MALFFVDLWKLPPYHTNNVLIVLSAIILCTYSTIYKVCLQVTILNMKLINPFSWDCYTYIYLYLTTTTTNLHIKISCTMLVYIPFWCSFMEHIKHNKFCSADDIISAKSLIYDVNKKRFVEFLLDLSVWNST